MNCLPYVLILALLFFVELFYFHIANRYNIIDKPNERSSHTSVVLRGGGIIFLIGVWIWSAFFGFSYPWFLMGLTLAAGVSFVDDIRSLPDSMRLLVQFVAAFLVFYQLDILRWHLWWVVLLALIVYVGIINVYNFMDGINGITAGYSLSVLVPLMLLNGTGEFVESSMIVVALLSVLVFCFFNFRPKGKAKCFAGDVGSIGIAFIILFVLGRVIVMTQDVTYLLLLAVYGVDSVLTIVHRIMLRENIGEAHRKHMYQLMANELGMSHVSVTFIYMGVQSLVSLGLVAFPVNKWLYGSAVILLLALCYVLFMRKYYHLHKEYLALKNR